MMIIGIRARTGPHAQSSKPPMQPPTAYAGHRRIQYIVPGGRPIRYLDSVRFKELQCTLLSQQDVADGKGTDRPEAQLADGSALIAEFFHVQLGPVPYPIAFAGITASHLKKSSALVLLALLR